MIPVIVIDDEVLIRSLIANSVDWQALGLEIVAEAENSEEALELAEIHKPRIAIVDINIPFVNGLDLAETLRHRYPGMVIIILTGYEEFSYARQAIKIGVLNYLLKPIDPEEFRNSLEAAREAIREEDRTRYRPASAPEAEVDARDDFLRTLVRRPEQLSDEEIDSGLRTLDIPLGGGELGVAALEVRAGEGGQELDDINVITGLFGEWLEPVELFRDENGRICLITGISGELVSSSPQTLFRACTWVRQQLTVHHDAGCAVGIGSIAETPRELQTAYACAETALDERFYTGKDTVYLYSEVEEIGVETSSHRSPVDRNSLLVLFRSGDEEEVADVINAIFADLQARRPRRQYCEMTVMEFVSVVVEFLEENSIGLAGIFEDGTDALSSIQGMASLPEMKTWLEDFVSQAVARIRGNVKTRTHMIVLKAKRYIETNYAYASLSLDHIADHISVTPSYISGVFKKQLGVSIVGYLTEVRVQQAKLLMDEDPFLSVGEVAEQVGYADAYYFSKVFRKHAGISPSAYVRRKRIAK